jgi:STE24 endopeptidase
VVLAGGVVAVLRWRLWSGAGVPSADPAPLEDWFDPGSLERASRYREGLWAMGGAAAVLAPAGAIAWAVVAWRGAPTILRLARGRDWAAGALVGGGLAVATTAAVLPVRVVRLAWGRHFDIITQGYGAWLLDVAKAVAVEAVVLGAVGAGLAVAIARLPRAWPLALAGGAAALVFVVSAAAPVVIEPLFQRTRPLEDPALRADVLALAERAGVPAREVVVNDASARTNASNAYVSGLGASRRIVLYDTLVRDAEPEEVRAVVAHELAHVARGHVVKGSVWAAALALPAALLLAAAVGWWTGFQAPGREPAGRVLVVRRIAVAGAAAACLLTVSAPLGNWISRAYEVEADWAALGLTDDPDAQIALQRGLAERSLADPDPPAAVRVWFGSHPTTLQRIGLALRARESGAGGGRSGPAQEPAG